MDEVTTRDTMDAGLHPEHLTAVALTPQEMPAEQHRLIAWCREKLRALNVERSDFLDNAIIAREHGWQHESLTAAAQRVRARMTYYEKIIAALDAGYLIVPNMPCEVMAVRVRDNRRKPTMASVEGSWASLPDVTGDPNLPMGTGKYVDDRPRGREGHVDRTDSRTGAVESIRTVTPVGFNDAVDFPVLAVKPRILSATAEAMALRLFDDIGVVTGRQRSRAQPARLQGDPVVVGRVWMPTASKWERTHAAQATHLVTFFIAWWVDTTAIEV